MASITIQSQKIYNWYYTAVGVSAKLRIYADQGFIASDNTVINQGSPDNARFYRELTITVANENVPGTSPSETVPTATIPQVTVHSTVDGFDVKTARYNCYFFDANGRKLGPYDPFTNIAIPAAFSGTYGTCGGLATCTTWAEVAIYNRGTVNINYQSTYTTDVIDAKIAAVQANAGIMMIDGLNASAQLFAVGTAGIAFNIVSSGTTHTYNIPLAATAGTTAGLLSKTDYDSFVAKITSVTGTANQISVGGTATAPILSTPQNIHTAATPVFAGLTLTGLSGVLKAAAGVISGSATTADLAESGNLYFTNSRARLALAATAPITYNNSTGFIGLSATTSDIAEGSNLYYTDTRARAAITANSPVSIAGGVISLGTVTIAKGGTALTAVGSSNQILGTNNAASALEYKSVLGTANQVVVTHAANSITLSTPQDIATVSTPTFNSLDITGTSVGFASGWSIVNAQQFDFLVSNAVTKPRLRYVGTGAGTGKWQFSNDGSAFQDLASNSMPTTNILLDGAQHSDTSASGSISAARGAIISVQDFTGTKLWAKLVPSSANRALIWDGTDTTFAQVNLNSTLVVNALQVVNGGTGIASTALNAYIKSNAGSPTGAFVTQAIPIPASDGGTGLVGAPSAGYIKSSGTAYSSQAVPIPIADGGTAVITLPTNGQLLIGNSNAYSLGAITGTTNRITVALGPGTIALNGPQDIHTGATPQFTGLTLLPTSTTVASQLAFREGSTNGINAVTLKAPDLLAADIPLILPDTAGTQMQLLGLASGSTTQLAFLSATSAMALDTTSIAVVDEFLGGDYDGTTAGAVGQLGWFSLTAATLTTSPATVGLTPHIGIVELKPTPSSGQAGIYLSTQVTAAMPLDDLNTNQNWMMVFIFRPSTTLADFTTTSSGAGTTKGAAFYVGVMDGGGAGTAITIGTAAAPAYTASNNGIYVRFDSKTPATATADTTNFRFVCRANGSEAGSVATGPTIIKDNWYKLIIQSGGGGTVTFTMTNLTASTTTGPTSIATNVPTTMVTPVFISNTRNDGAATAPLGNRLLTVDYFGFNLKGVTR